MLHTAAAVPTSTELCKNSCICSRSPARHPGYNIILAHGAFEETIRFFPRLMFDVSQHTIRLCIFLIRVFLMFTLQDECYNLLIVLWDVNVAGLWHTWGMTDL